MACLLLLKSALSLANKSSLDRGSQRVNPSHLLAIFSVHVPDMLKTIACSQLHFSLLFPSGVHQDAQLDSRGAATHHHDQWACKHQGCGERTAGGVCLPSLCEDVDLLFV